MSKSTIERREKISGCLLGMAVADALGVPREGLTPNRAKKLFGDGELEHRLVLQRGMISDDTEHACMTAQALLRSDGKVDRFGRSLAWRLRWWLLGVPAGIGLGTLRAILKLWVGFSPSKSGVCSAGNGPAMRAPIIGVLLSGRGDLLKETVDASTRITHCDMRAEQGALAIAVAAEYAAHRGHENLNPLDVMDMLIAEVNEAELVQRLECVRAHLERQSSAENLASELGLERGVTGYINNTVPVAIFCWLRYVGDFRRAVETSIKLGGDADTVGAITGALAGTTTGVSGIPETWLDHLAEWPRSVNWIKRLAERLETRYPGRLVGEYQRPLPFFWPGQLVRNAVFAVIVLTHGFRRLLPPY